MNVQDSPDRKGTQLIRGHYKSQYPNSPFFYSQQVPPTLDSILCTRPNRSEYTLGEYPTMSRPPPCLALPHPVTDSPFLPTKRTVVFEGPSGVPQDHKV